MFLVHQVLEFLDMPNEDLTLACTTVQVPLIPWLLEKNQSKCKNPVLLSEWSHGFVIH